MNEGNDSLDRSRKKKKQQKKERKEGQENRKIESIMKKSGKRITVREDGRWTIWIAERRDWMERKET